MLSCPKKKQDLVPLFELKEYEVDTGNKNYHGRGNELDWNLKC